MNCPICSSQAITPMYPHPEANLYRCNFCTHAFGIPIKQETYSPDYFEKTHRRWFSNPNTNLFDHVASKIPQGATVLDVGCGNGQFLRYIKSKRADLNLTGVDLAPNPPEPGIKYHQGNILNINLQQFDAVVSFAVIEHIPDVVPFVKKISTLLRPNGVAAIMTLNDSSLLYAMARAGKAMGIPIAFDRLYSAHHVHHFTRRSLRHLLTSNGFKVEKEILHNMPMAAIDIPVSGQISDFIFRIFLWIVFRASELSRTSYLQTMILRSTK